MKDEHAKPLLNDLEPLFTPFDRAALSQLIDAIARPGCRIAEIGTWTGLGSTQTFIAKLRQIPQSSLVCVDTWRGAASSDYQRELAGQYDLFGTFRNNVVAYADEVHVVPIAADSLAAAHLIADRSFDLIFIDADHRYDCVKSDIAAWLPKVRRGGILCGHDCEGRVTPEDKALFSGMRDRDTIEMSGRPFRHFHPGAILAVDEAFAGRASLFAETSIQLDHKTSGRSTIWHVKVGRLVRRLRQSPFNWFRA